MHELSSRVRIGAPPNEQIPSEIWKQARTASLLSKQGSVLFLGGIRIDVSPRGDMRIGNSSILYLLALALALAA